MKKGKKEKENVITFISAKENDSQMLMYEARLQTFQNWPFKSKCKSKSKFKSKCTPQKMAEAGFYCCGGNNEPDLVRCYFCRKELVCIVHFLPPHLTFLYFLKDGWEPDDDPWKEHESHARSGLIIIHFHLMA